MQITTYLLYRRYGCLTISKKESDSMRPAKRGVGVERLDSYIRVYYIKVGPIFLS